MDHLARAKSRLAEARALQATSPGDAEATAREAVTSWLDVCECVRQALQAFRSLGDFESELDAQALIAQVEGSL